MSSDRRSLVEGLKTATIDPAVEKEFVHKGKPITQTAKQAHEPKPTADAGEGKGQPANQISRSPLTTRVRTDYATALKRASLQRQLSGETPNTLQDILEEALEPWLRSKGYIS
jgi:hypothetical protein